MKLGVIGTGNMARSILTGVLENKILQKEEIIASDSFAPNRKIAKDKFDIEVTGDNKLVAGQADVILLSIKPQHAADVIAEVKDLIKPETLIISIAAGKSLAWLSEQFGKDVKIVRCMPNIAAMVGQAMTGYCPNRLVTDEEIDFVERFLSSFGRCEMVQEVWMDTVTAVSGSSPVCVFMMIEAMADAAVAGGMPRAYSYEFAAQAVYGSAKMILETGMHPSELKDMVCSPGGTAIEVVRVLEERGFRSALFDSIEQCKNKSARM